ncbi:MAG: DNA ligase [Polaromonas sp.]|uniref:DNA ligase n=1 Tax=Polaromonas sp. TaxID=1869339 RepID=UPI0025DBA711|nr:DNA ligase [Polaromonas sp.]MBI2725107.1 DNA ligase [Polaromonas sp.]
MKTLFKAPVLRASLLALLLASGNLLSLAPAMAQSAIGKPALMLANVYHPGVVLADYWVSEKYDGVRGFWDGEKLLTRGGERVMAPAWFTAGWPKTPMDGEFWAGRGQFSRAVSTVRQQVPDDTAWRGMRFMVFDLPAQSGPFTERIPALNGLVSQIDKPWVVAVVQYRVASHAALQAQLKKTVKLGGEGLMLHRGDSLYKGLRNDDLLKVKTHEDAEARVVGHVAGKGKNSGRLGALLVEMPAEGGKPAQRFRLGTGFSDAQRQNPPPVGALVTYRYRGLNDSGIPRFASFMRVREDGI